MDVASTKIGELQAREDRSSNDGNELRTDVEGRVGLNAASRLLMGVIAVAVDFMLTPYLLSHFGRAMVGLQVVASDSLRYLVLLGQAAGAGYMREAIAHHARGDFARMNAVLSGGLVLMLGAAGLVAVGAAGVAWFADSLLGLQGELLPVGRAVILITGLSSALGLLLNVWESPTFIRQLLYLTDLSLIVSQVIGALLVVVVFETIGPSVLFWVAAMLGVRFFLRVFWVVPACARALPAMRIRARPLPKREMVGLARFGGYYFLGGIGTLLTYASATIVIANLDALGPEKVVSYSVAQRWDPMVRQVVMALAGALTPVMTGFAGVGDFDALRAVLLRGTRYCFLLGMFPCVVLIVYAEPFIRHWVGESFVPEAAPVLRWLLGALLVSLPAILALEVLFALGRIGRAVALELSLGAVSVILGVTLVNAFDLGLLGIAWGLVATQLLKNVVCVPFLVLTELKLETRQYLRDGFLRPLCVLAMLLASSTVFQQLWPPTSMLVVLLHFAILACVFAVFVWSVGLTSTDRASAKTVLRRVRAALPR